MKFFSNSRHFERAALASGEISRDLSSSAFAKLRRDSLEMTIVFFFAIIFFALPAKAELLLSEKFVLDNGLELVVIPNTRIDAINHKLIIKAGAADDTVGKSGIAHFLEHMMFKGSKNFKKGEYSRTINSLGGNFNAYTGHDLTAYWVNISAKHLETVMKLEADRFANLTLDAKEFGLEKKVVLEERASVIENNPKNLFFEELRLALYKNHPYRMPVIGFEREIKRISIADMKQFYAKHYVPENATLIISGNITPAAALAKVQKYYGKIKPGKKQKRVWKVEPNHHTRLDITMKNSRISQPVFVKRYITPSIFENEDAAMALYVLSEILGGSQVSYLYEELVEKEKIASDVSVSYSGLHFGPGSFSFMITPREGVTLEQTQSAFEKAMNEFLDREELEEAAIKRAKNLYKASLIYSLEGLSAPSYLITQIIASGLEHDYLNTFDAKIEEVSEQQILDAARRMYSSKNFINGFLDKK